MLKGELISKNKEDFNLMEHIMKWISYARVLASHRTGTAVPSDIYFSVSPKSLSVSWSEKEKNYTQLFNSLLERL